MHFFPLFHETYSRHLSMVAFVHPFVTHYVQQHIGGKRSEQLKTAIKAAAVAPTTKLGFKNKSCKLYVWYGSMALLSYIITSPYYYHPHNDVLECVLLCLVARHDDLFIHNRHTRHRVSPEFIGSRNCVPMAFTAESPPTRGQ